MQKTTLEQWAILEKVIDLGSFAKAADALHRSQSSVSYNLSLLQERLGVTLLIPQGRRAVLTPAGELLLSRVRPLLNAFSHVEMRAADLQDGMRSRLSLVVDSIFPRGRLFAILRKFQQTYPRIQVQLTEVLESTQPDAEAFAEADIMIVTRRQDVNGHGEWLMNIDFIAVAHADHPLFTTPESLTEEILNQYPLVRIADSRDVSLPAGDAWTFSTVDAAIEAVTSGVGYGWLPQAHILAPLEKGILKPLPLSHGARRATPLHLIIREEQLSPDEVMNHFLDLLKE
ncbi:LysR family transcriptional regulator [Scandinavium sp. V105_16]|uniref:LysR family transcriptional regulator n=1 Tax=Scandinavium lactucae TaxID=3095028 RepID=A0AAJ2SC96_9ENTR|nr:MULTISPECIES: LysR family transcriptional regulator [unclassified Scandinavium]MDX6022416.1 LysR family transcriptional regulator [Scandinavium sp. V105_16]MDX6033742.1 LysR family transcriptional regulator [Scandinavium sp. V105_12]MDX6042410.1 LysR family transcriptional regulator [Scandinavium sp. V105_6]MDX6052411.1 LysR family transcriptional regulator [Scandinavium sp. V105_1]